MLADMLRLYQGPVVGHKRSGGSKPRGVSRANDGSFYGRIVTSRDVSVGTNASTANVVAITGAVSIAIAVMMVPVVITSAGSAAPLGDLYVVEANGCVARDENGGVVIEGGGGLWARGGGEVEGRREEKGMRDPVAPLRARQLLVPLLLPTPRPHASGFSPRRVSTRNSVPCCLGSAPVQSWNGRLVGGSSGASDGPRTCASTTRRRERARDGERT